MKQFFYSVRYLIHKKGTSSIKIISLSLGLLLGVILFARVAFEMSYDKFYEDHDKLYSIMCLYTIGGDNWDPIPVVNAPMPGAFNQHIPEIKYATVATRPYPSAFVYDEKRFMPVMLSADSSFFKTMGIRLLRGDATLLSVDNNLFLSVEMAKIIFGNEDPMGKILRGNGDQLFTIQGVFETIPENSHLKFDVVGSLDNNFEAWMWEGRDSFYGYVRLEDNASPVAVDQKMPGVIRQYRDEEAREARGTKADYYLQPVSEMHSGDSNVKRMCLILSILAMAILLIASLNYILISISSLANRVKAVGIHKCNGASSVKIFNMFMSETAILIGVSVIISLILLLAFRGVIENITNTSFSGLFHATHLWIPVLVVGVIFFISGYAPAHILSRTPVTQVFRAVTANKKYWKRGLLFVQFSGVTFILVLLLIVISQYRMISEKDLGYNPDGIVYSWINISGETEEKWIENVQFTKQEFLRIPYVTHAANNASDLTSNYSGMPVTDENNNVLFTMRWTVFDYDYIETMGMEFVHGENFSAPGQVIVNETFVRMMGWTDNPIGKTVKSTGDEGLGNIVGVVKDYPISSLYNEQSPMVAQGYPACGGQLTLRIADFNSQKLTELNDKLAALFPDQIREFTVMQNVLTDQYSSARQFRDSITAAFCIVLLITAMGLFGYITDEIIRRSKEIAIRKVNGAEANNILTLLYKDISYLSLPAIIFGILIAIYIGRKWLEDFAVKISLSPQIFVISGMFILFIILVIVTGRAWKVANENPVESIKSE